jgi:hypothetical protein
MHNKRAATTTKTTSMLFSPLSEKPKMHMITVTVQRMMTTGESDGYDQMRDNELPQLMSACVVHLAGIADGQSIADKNKEEKEGYA